MDIARDSYSPNTNIYKYIASMKYILGSKIIDIPMENIKSIAIDSNYKQMNMPMIFITAMVHKSYANEIEEHQNEGIFILNIQRAVANSDMPSLYTKYIEDSFIYFMARDTSGNAEFSDHENQEADFSESQNEDLYRVISLGLLSVNHINKNKKDLNGIYTGDLLSVMYYITGHLPILIEPPRDNKQLNYQIMPPMNSIAKSLEYLNSVSTFYDTPYRFFIDFDCAYLLSSSGSAVRRKDEDITTVFITMRDGDGDGASKTSEQFDVGSKIQGMTINRERMMYEIDVDDSDCEVSDNHISGKSYSKLAGTDASGNMINKTVTDSNKNNVKEKTKNIRISNENTGVLDNMVASLNSSAIQVLVQKTDIDTSVLTMNKEYYINADDVYDDHMYTGKYLLVRKRELYIKFNEVFTLSVMLLFEKL